MISRYVEPLFRPPSEARSLIFQILSEFLILYNIAFCLKTSFV